MPNLNQELLPPPRLSGDPQSDYAALITYLWSFYRIVHTNYQLKSSMVDALALLIPAADKLAYTTSGNTAELISLTAFARTLLGSVDAAEVRARLEIPTASSGSFDLTLTGCTTTPTVHVAYSKSGTGQVTLCLNNALTATSNSTSKTLTGLPASLIPSSAGGWLGSRTQIFMMNCGVFGDNGGPFTSGIVSISTSDGVITLHPTWTEATPWTASGQCFVNLDPITYI